MLSKKIKKKKKEKKKNAKQYNSLNEKATHFNYNSFRKRFFRCKSFLQ
jgi:hypothetical protein